MGADYEEGVVQACSMGIPCGIALADYMAV